MFVGILQKNKASAVEIKESGNTFVVEKEFITEGSIDYKNAVVGLPLDNFIIKNIYLPKITKKELQSAIELQIEFYVPNHLKEYDTTYIAKEYKSGYLLQIIATKKNENFKKTKAVIPAPLGLYSYAIHQKLLKKSENRLIIYINEENATSITMKGNEPVFMREYTLETVENIKSRIQLSSQAVYLEAARYFIEIDKIIVVSKNDKYSKQIIDALGDDKEIQWIDSSEYEKKEGNILLQVGLALFHKKCKAMSGWSISKKPPTTRESIKKILIVIIPIIIIFLPIYYFAGYYATHTKNQSIQIIINAFSKKLGDVDQDKGKATKAKDYMAEIGDPILNLARINKLFNVINLCRSDNLWVSSISGKIDDLIVVNGFTDSYEYITAFLKKLEASKFTQNINLIYSNEASGKNISYQLTLKMEKGSSFILDSKTQKKDKDTLGISNTKTLIDKNIKQEV